MPAIKTTVISILAVGLLAGSAVGVAAQDEEADPMAAASVTGSIRWGSSCAFPTTTAEEGFVQERGAGCEPRTVTSDDPRLAGTSVIAWNKDIHITDEDQRRSIRSMTEVIRGEGGGWVCHAPAALDESSEFFHTPVQGSDLYTCVGDGDNAGLMALLAVETGSSDGTQQDPFQGLIFPGELPPIPEIPAE